MKKNKHSLKISYSHFDDITINGDPIEGYSYDELVTLKNLLTKILCKINEYVED